MPEPSISYQIKPIPAYATLRDTCATFGISLSRLYDLCGLKLVRTRKLGKRVLVDQQSVLAYLESLPSAPIRPPARRRQAEQRKASRRNLESMGASK